MPLFSSISIKCEPLSLSQCLLFALSQCKGPFFFLQVHMETSFHNTSYLNEGEKVGEREGERKRWRDGRR